MGARLRVFLNQEEERTLWELRGATTVPQRVKDRADAVRLNHEGWYVEKIAAHLHWKADSVRKALHQWIREGLGGLWEKKGRGRKRCWEEADLEYLEEVLRQDPRSYTAQQLVDKLSEERGVNISAAHLRHLLKKRGSSGSAIV